MNNMAMLLVQESAYTTMVGQEREPITNTSLRTLFGKKKVLEMLKLSSEQEFFQNFSLLVDGARFEALDEEVSQYQRVVVLPRIVGGC